MNYGAAEGELPTIQTTFGQLQWTPRQSDSTKSSILPPRGTGEEPLYLWFCVEDTGPGITPEEMKKLFKRFSQANPRTHIEYGGSGIGLYICHKLVDKQDGGVGVASSLGEGSVFGFYVETRRVKEPPIGSPPLTTQPQFSRRSSDRSGLAVLPLSSDLSSTTSTRLVSQRQEKLKRPALIRPHTEPVPIRFNLLLVEDVSHLCLALVHMTFMSQG